MIGILDYGLGNIFAIKNIFLSLNVKVKLIREKNDFNDVNKLILPGVGSFDKVIKEIKKKNLYDDLDFFVKLKKFPIMGICVGMQIMLEKSEEGKLPGFGWIKGNVKKFKINNNFYTPVPHIGWNSIRNLKKKIFYNIDEKSIFYFLHSYYCVPENIENEISKTNYYIDFCSAMEFENIIGLQFHPEKSHSFGKTIFKNFINHY